MTLRTNDLLDAVSWVAHDQMGLITAAQLEHIGIPRSSLARRIRTGGAWRRVLPGTYAVFPGPLSIEQREMAGMLFTGQDARLTGASGMRRWGIEYLPDDPMDAQVHTLIPLTRHRKSSGFVTVERTKRHPVGVEIDGIAVASLERCIVDAGRRITDRRTTRAFVLEAIQREKVGIGGIADELARAQRRGTALLRECLDEARAGVRSAPEAELRHLMEQAGFTGVLWNPVLRLPTGKFVAQPDGLIRRSMTVLEVQSRQFHAEGDRFVSTLSRATEFGGLGLIVVHVIPSEMRRDPIGTLRQLTAAHERGLERPVQDLIIEDARGRRPNSVVDSS
jgi:hypothetical protein